MEQTPEAVKTDSLPTPEPMKVAAWVVENQWPGNRLIYSKESYFEFHGGAWLRRSDSDIRAAVWRATEDLRVVIAKRNSKGQDYVVHERYAPSSRAIDSVMDALASLPGVRRGFTQLPAWLDSGDRPDPTRCVGFRDVVCTLDGASIPRDPNWFDLTTIPVDYDPDATCPRWDAALQQWSLGSDAWKLLLQLWFGYCLTNHRRYAKWLLMYGKSRAGKGVIAAVLQALIGQEAFANVNQETMGRAFGSHSLVNARVLNIPEVHHSDRGGYERLAAILKRLVGADPQPVDVKYKDTLTNVVIAAAPMVQSNEMPQLPDRSGSVSSKMLVLPFHWSTRDPGSVENPNLKAELLEELPGIAAWAFRGAQMLESLGGKFPVLEEARETLEVFHGQNAPMDAFLERYFVRNRAGFVAVDLLWERWVDWCRFSQMDNYLNRNTVKIQVKENTSWPLQFHRMASGERARGLRGLSLKEVPGGS